MSIEAAPETFPRHISGKIYEVNGVRMRYCRGGGKNKPHWTSASEIFSSAERYRDAEAQSGIPVTRPILCDRCMPGLDVVSSRHEF